MSEEKYQPPTFGVIDYLNKERLYTPEFCKIIDDAEQRGYLAALGDVEKLTKGWIEACWQQGDKHKFTRLALRANLERFKQRLEELKSCVSSCEASRAGKEGEK